VMIIFSSLRQLAACANAPAISWGAEIGLMMSAIIVIARLWRTLPPDMVTVRSFLQTHLPQVSAIAAVIFFLVIGSACPFLAVTTSQLPGIGAEKPIGALSYLAIGCSTYALSRRYAWPPTAVTVTMVVLSMPRLVRIAITAGPEIMGAAISLFCLLALFRAVEQPSLQDILLLWLGICFGVEIGPMGLSFSAIMLLLALLVLVRRHGMQLWWNHLRGRWMVLPVVCIATALVIGAQLTSVANDGGHALVFNPDGIQGSLANLWRYFLASAHFCQPVDLLVNLLFGFSLTGLINQMYASTGWVMFGDIGAQAPFMVNWEPGNKWIWFGPLAFLLVWPAVVYALRKGPRRLKAVALALTGYLYLATLIPAWSPGNVQFLTRFFVCAGFMIAFLLPPWRFSRKGKLGIELISIFLMIYGCVGAWLACAETACK
jgi:hypothetical protein